MTRSASAASGTFSTKLVATFAPNSASTALRAWSCAKVQPASPTGPTYANATLNGAGATGNYVQFDNIVLASTGSIGFTSTSDTFRNFENGIQLVTAPEPATLGVAAVGATAALARRRQRRRTDG